MPAKNQEKNWISQIFSGIAEVVKQADSTTKLLATIILAAITFLTILALNGVEGYFQFLVVGAAIVIVLFGLYIASSLEKLRIVQGNQVVNSSIASSRKKAEKHYDVFISAPMETSLDHDGNVSGRAKVMDIKRHLEVVYKFENIFYASSDKVSKTEFDNNSVALSQNFKILLSSRKYIFIYPEKKPSSTLVEVGMALALGIPNIWFVKEGVELPFLLRQAWQSSSAGSELPKIAVHRYSNFDSILAFISDRSDLFL